MNKVITVLENHATGRKIFIFFLLSTSVYLAMLLITIPKVLSFSEGMKVLDMMPGGYGPDYVLDLFKTLGEEGRRVYLWNQIPLDMLYPGLFGITYSLMLFYILKILLRKDSNWFILAFLPLAGGFFDYLENIGIIIMLNSYPSFSALLVKLTSISTVLKSVSITISFVVLLVCLGLLLWNKLKPVKK